jgi:hypothetical protein
MAAPGFGFRTAADVLFEISMHLCQPSIYQFLVNPITAGSGVTATVPSTFYMYPGAELVIETPGSSEQEVVTILTVPSATTFTANFANSHASGIPAWGATFPTQQGTDPIFTQAEMLQYLSRAQNEFLTAVPCFYQRFFQNVSMGQVYQSTPPTAILIDRIAASALNVPIISIARLGNMVGLSAAGPTGLQKYSTFSVVGAPDPTLNGVFAVSTSALNSTFLTYSQIGPDVSISNAGFVQSMRRLYEVTQEELVQQNRNWQVDYVGPLQNWFEDRAGLYQWGVGGIPQSSFPVELLVAVRDVDSLGMTDGFLIPDCCVHGAKWLALNYIWSKNGVQSNPQMAEFALKRYAQVVMATGRYIQAMKMGTK